MNNNFLLEPLPKHCCHWQSHLPPKLGPEEVARHELWLAQAQLSFSSWSLKEDLPLHIPGKEDVSWDSQGRWAGTEHLSWPPCVCHWAHAIASASKFTPYKPIHSWVRPSWDTCPVGKHMCLPQPACFEHLLSIITLSKAGGEGAQGSSAWQCRSHDGAHFSLICCGTLDARWNLRDEIWAISCFSSFWTVINTIKKAEQWGFPTPLLSRPISKAVAEMPSAAFVDPGLRSPCSLLSNRKAEQIKHKLSLEAWRRGGKDEHSLSLCAHYVHSTLTFLV